MAHWRSYALFLFVVFVAAFGSMTLSDAPLTIEEESTMTPETRGPASPGFHAGFLARLKTGKDVYKARTAVPRLECANGTAHSSCAAVVVSKDCRIATAAHCVTACLPGLAHEFDVQFEQTESGETTTREIAPEKRTFPVSVNGRTYAARIAASGKSTLQILSINEATMASADDWAVLELERFRCDSCLSTREPIDGEKVWAIGYPLLTQVKDGSRPPRLRRRFSPGIVHAKADESPSFKEWSEELRKAGDDSASRLLFATVPLEKGNSGGPLVTETGAVLGLVSGGLNKTEESMWHRGNGAFVPILEIKKHLGPEKSNEIFNCPNGTK